MKASGFLAYLRKELERENERILNNEFLKEAEKGTLEKEKIRLFAVQQNYIVSYDLRSLATMLARSQNQDELEFFYTLVVGDKEALRQLRAFSEELGLRRNEVEKSPILAEAVAYTHYLAWLAHYANAGEQATALVVNLPIWGSVVKRLGSALKENYSIKQTGFFELFAGPYDALEGLALKVMEGYIDEHKDGMERCARLIQRYELMFWEGVYRG
ncbi:MAG: TenA family transcriptional regulator [Nitrososphaerota archaeon]